MDNAEEKIKLSALKVVQINKLLKIYGLPLKGTKDAKRAVLTEHLDADEVESSELQADDGVNNATVNNLQQMMSQLTKAIETLTTNVNIINSTRDDYANAAEQHATNEVTNNQRATNAVNVANDVSERDSDGEVVLADVTPGVIRMMLPTNRANSEAHGIQVQSTSHPTNTKTWSVTEVAGMLADFNPLTGTMSSQQFVDRTKQLQNAFKWNDELVMCSLHLKLKGPAREWLDANPIFTTWSQFAIQFISDFPCRMNDADVHRELMKRKKRMGESLIEYYYKMLSIGRRGRLDDLSIISYIIDGINDQNVRKMLRAVNFKTCDELLESLSTMEKTVRVSTSSATVVKTEQDGNSTNKQFINKRNIKCFNCNTWGHFSRDCPKPQRRNKQNNVPTRPDVAPLDIADGENGQISPILKRIIMFGKTFEGMVDTGSVHSLIEESSVPSEAQRENSTKILKAYGGANIVSSEKFKTHAIVDDQQAEVVFHIVPNGMSPYSILLGRDIVCNNKVKLVLESGTMMLIPKDTESVLALNSTAISNFNISTSLSEEQRQNLLGLLEEYEVEFAEELDRLGRSKSFEMKISIKQDDPVVGKRCPIPFAHRDEFTSILSNLENHGIIRRSRSLHSSSVILVPKSNGELRMCIDYRALNAITIKKNYPMPVVEEQLSKLSGNNTFTVLDMTSGYYQIPLTEESKPLTAFQTHDGLYEHNVMPFGLVNAPMQFQEMMSQVLANLSIRKHVISYVDEVILATPSVEQGIVVLGEVLEAIRTENLTIRPSKCRFLEQTVHFLGRIVDAEGIRPGREKTKCILDFPVPTNVSEVRQFIGVTNYFCKFIMDYGIIAQPITWLLKNSVQFHWGNDQKTAFEKLKQTLLTAPVVALYDPLKSHEVHTDACRIGISGILLQHEKDVLKPIFYYSRQCTEAEMNYASHELEVLAIVETVTRFGFYLLGKAFIVRTDCNAITTTKATTPLPARIARWWLRQQEFNFQVVNRPGYRMGHADGLSRAPVLRAIEQETVGEYVMLVTNKEPMDWVAAVQRQDDSIVNSIKVLQGQPSLDAKQIKTDYTLSNGRLFRVIDGKRVLVAPKAVRWRIVKYAHDDSGHFGIDKTTERIKRDFWFRGIRCYVKSYVASCPQCCYNKAKGGKSEGELHVTEAIPIPFRTVHIDHLGPFPRSKKGNMHIIVMVCAFTKYVVLKPVRNTKTTPVIMFLRDFMACFGQPVELVSDRGTTYTSKEFESYLKRYGITHRKMAVRTPRANGQVERINRTLLAAVKCSTSDAKVWDETLTNIQWALKSQKNATTRCSPNELVFKYNLQNVSENRLVQALTEEDTNHLEDATPLQCMALKNINEERQKWKERFDNAHVRPRQYLTDDLVVIDYVSTATGTSHKLDPAYKGPYIVTKVLGNDRYVVEDLPNSGSKRRYVGVVSADNMKPWCRNEPSLVEYDSPVEDESSRLAEL